MDFERCFQRCVIVEVFLVVEDMSGCSGVMVDALCLLLISIQCGCTNYNVFIKPDFIVVIQVVRDIPCHEYEGILNTLKSFLNIFISSKGIVSSEADK